MPVESDAAMSRYSDMHFGYIWDLQNLNFSFNAYARCRLYTNPGDFVIG